MIFDNQRNTIYALSSNPGQSAIAVIRVSGTKASTVYKSITKETRTPEPKYIALKKLYSPNSNNLIDIGMVVWFKAPHSFTGEDSVEFYVHGGPNIIKTMFKAINASHSDTRLAEAGEFTYRAYMNNKVDLVTVEGISDLIHAETDLQREQALKQAEGHTYNLYSKWHENVLKILSYYELMLNYEEYYPNSKNILRDARILIEKTLKEITEHLSNDKNYGEKIKNGLNVVIYGHPNTGKSSLLNTLVRENYAIVSNIPGTTRDPVEVKVDLDGLPTYFVDTAGIRDTQHPIEKEGIKRTETKIQNADLKLLLITLTSDEQKISSGTIIPQRKKKLSDQTSASKKPPETIKTLQDLNKKIQEITKQYPCDKKTIIVINKTDLYSEEQKNCLSETEHFPISTITKEGITQLLSEIKKRLQFCPSNNNNILITRRRYGEALEQAKKHLETSLHSATPQLEIQAENIRLASRNLGHILGMHNPEKIFTTIFSEFCIGK